MKKWFLLIFLILLSYESSGQAAREVAVELSARLDINNNTELSWKSDTGVLRYYIYHRIHEDSNWVYLDSVSPTVLAYTITGVPIGAMREYKVSKRKNNLIGFLGNGYIRVGFKVSENSNRGKVLVAIDSNMVIPLRTEISNYITQLENEGYTIIKRSFLRTDSVSKIKNWIFQKWVADSTNIKTVFLIGHIPVPYSGNIAPDGHTGHKGAWPADLYYGSFYTTWSDNSVNVTTASRSETNNIPGDGKFDLGRLNPSGTTWANTRKYQLPVGRVDFYNMKSFGTDTVLLRRYFKKNLAFRKGEISFINRALIDDNFGFFSGESFASGGFRNFSTFSKDSIIEADYSGTGNGMKSRDYLWSYGCGSGSYTGCSGVASSSSLITDSLLNPFTMLFGSYFGDWDNEDNFLRAPLASKGWGLACAWSGRPYWMFHDAALGFPLYKCVKATINATNIYNVGNFSSGVHVALMGDPTLTVFPVANLILKSAITRCYDSFVSFTWLKPKLAVDSVRIEKWIGTGWKQIATISGNDTSFSGYLSGGKNLMSFRFKKLMTSSSGSWWDLSARSSILVAVDMSCNVTWSGTGNWSDNNYWSTASQPKSTDSIRVLGGVLTVNSSKSIKTLILNNGSTVKLGADLSVTELNIQNGILDINGFRLTINGVLYSNTDSLYYWIKGSPTSNLTYSGTNSSFLYMDLSVDGNSNRLNSLTLKTGAILKLGNTLYIHGNLSNSTGDLVLGMSSKLTSNTIPSAAAMLRLKLSSTNNPAIVALNGGSIEGEVYYEDYLNSGYRAYRQWGHCLDSTSGMSLNQLTDDIDLFADVISGSGGRGNSGNVNGLLASTATAKNSIFTYDESLFGTSSRWVPYKVNGASVVYAIKGRGLHFVLRPTGTGENGSYDPQVIDYEGQINTIGDVSVSVTRSSTLGSNDGWNLLSNPYPSYLSWATFVNDNASSLKNSTNQSLYKYDKSTKNYKATTLSGPNWYNSSSIGLTAPSIDPGDAFFTQIKSGVSTLTFKRTQTTTTREVNIDRTNKLEIDTNSYSTLYMKMRSVSDSTIGDEITLLSASWGGDMSYSAGDALNLGGTCLDLSIICSDDQKLAFKTINHWGSWLVPLYMVSCTQGDYFFDISINSNNNGPSVQFELIDNFNNSKKVLKNGDRIFYKITADSNSFRAGRFFLNSFKKNVGLEGQNRLMQNWVIYPNPANKDDEISLVNSMGLVGNLSILDSKGSQIYNKQYNQGNFVEKINLSQLNLPAGVYFIHLLNNGTKSTLRFIVKEN